MSVVDYRLMVGFADHPKTIRLISMIGVEGLWCLLRLFEYARLHRTKGDLYGMDRGAIEIAAKWQGDPGKFVSALLGCGGAKGRPGFLERVKRSKSHFRLHDWAEHQPFSCNQEARTEAARRGANARWDKRHSELSGAGSNAEGNASGNAEGSAGSNARGNAPTPTPTPTPAPIAIRRRNDATPEHRGAVEYFCQAYEKWAGFEYDFKRGKDGWLVKDMLSRYSLDDFRRIVDRLFVTTDEFITKTDRGINILSQCSNKLMLEVKGNKGRNQKGGVRDYSNPATA